MYGSATELVLTFNGGGVHRFTLDPSLGEFIHIEANVKIPSSPKVGSVSFRFVSSSFLFFYYQQVSTATTQHKGGQLLVNIHKP